MSSNIKVNRICIFCSNGFIAKTTATKYCSKKCNSADYKAKVRAKKVERSNTETKQITNKPIQDIQSKEFLSVKDVSILLGCSIRTAYRLINNGTLKAVNLSVRMTRVNKSEVHRLLKSSLPLQIEKEQEPVIVIKEPENIQIDITDCYTLVEVQKQYGISEKALHQLIKRNSIPKIKHGWYAYVPKTIIDELFT